MLIWGSEPEDLHGDLLTVVCGRGGTAREGHIAIPVTGRDAAVLTATLDDALRLARSLTPDFRP